MKKRAARRPLTSRTAEFVEDLRSRSTLEKALAIASGSFLLPLADDAMKAAQAVLTGEWTEERPAPPPRRKRPARSAVKKRRAPRAK